MSTSEAAVSPAALQPELSPWSGFGGVFVRPAKSTDRYVLAPLDSEIATWEGESAFGLETLSCQDFIVSNEENLRRIASTSSPAKDWVGRYTDRCSPSPQRTTLVGLLSE